MAELWNRELLTRVASALALLPLVVFAVAYGGIAYSVMVTIAGAVMIFEWGRLTAVAPRLGRAAAIAGLILLGVGAVLFQNQAAARDATIAAALSALTLAGISRLFGWRDLLWICLGLTYVVLPVGALIYLRLAPEGAFWVFWTLFIVWATDVGAFFAGRIIGGPKLAPRFSPKKTWAGFFGGLGLAVGAAWAVTTVTVRFWETAMPEIAPPLLLAAGLSLLSQVGDLTESALKRRFDVKDSSHLIPGHGGLLDRVDSLVFAAVGVAVYWGINYA